MMKNNQYWQKRRKGVKFVKRIFPLIRKKKYYCDIYLNRNYPDNYFTEEVLDRFDIWLAQCDFYNAYKRHKIWQFTGSWPLDGKPHEWNLNYLYYWVINYFFNYLLILLLKIWY